MAGDGISQQAIARRLGVSQPTVSQALAASARVCSLDAGLVHEAALAVIKAVAEQRAFSDLANSSARLLVVIPGPIRRST